MPEKRDKLSVQIFYIIKRYDRYQYEFIETNIMGVCQRMPEKRDMTVKMKMISCVSRFLDFKRI